MNTYTFEVNRNQCFIIEVNADSLEEAEDWVLNNFEGHECQFTEPDINLIDSTD